MTKTTATTYICNNCTRTNRKSTINAQRAAGFRLEHLSCQHCGQHDLIETQAKVYKAYNRKYLMPASTPRQQYLIDGQSIGADIGTCRTSKGRTVTTWGLNLSAHQIEDGKRYVRTAAGFELIIY